MTNFRNETVCAGAKSGCPLNCWILPEFVPIEKVTENVEALFIAKACTDVRVRSGERSSDKAGFLQHRSERALVGCNANQITSQHQWITRGKHRRQRVIRWSAGGDCIPKDDALLGKAIEKRRGRTLVAQMPNVVRTQAIYGDEDRGPGPPVHTAPCGAQRVSHS